MECGTGVPQEKSRETWQGAHARLGSKENAALEARDFNTGEKVITDNERKKVRNDTRESTDDIQSQECVTRQNVKSTTLTCSQCTCNSKGKHVKETKQSLWLAFPFCITF